MPTIDLDQLFIKQKELDEEIALLHQVSYETTHDKRVLALLVEVAELANASRCFKYWSNKGAEPKQKVLDEFADGLHFFLSLGIDIHAQSHIFEYDDLKIDASKLFIEVYDKIVEFANDPTEKKYRVAFNTFLSLVYPLGFRIEELVVAYYLKLAENHQRQQNNY